MKLLIKAVSFERIGILYVIIESIAANLTNLT
eukprot:UN01830